MAAIARRKLERALARKGFRKEEASRDHCFWWFYYQGKKTHIFTKISRGSGYKDYGDELLNKVKLQLRLDTVGQLRDFVDCPMTEQDYITYLKGKGII
jgi:hypothetical protein